MNVRVARRYAQALMAVAAEEKAVDAIGSDLTSIGKTLAASRELQLLVESPVIREGKKIAIFKDLWASRVNPITISFIVLLAKHRREGILPAVVVEYLALKDEAQGTVEVQVQTAQPMSGDQEGALVTRLEAYTRKKIRMRKATDPAIRGGMVIRIGDTVLDGSVRRQLERLRERFLEGGAAGQPSDEPRRM
jgi:F-type H+-transporting ATPase subunit delta